MEISPNIHFQNSLSTAKISLEKQLLLQSFKKCFLCNTEMKEDPLSFPPKHILGNILLSACEITPSFLEEPFIDSFQFLK